MRIAELVQFIGRKYLEGTTTKKVVIPAGTKLILRNIGGRYELLTDEKQVSSND